MKRHQRPAGEFDLIAKYFAPLSREFPGAYALTDDAATVRPSRGHEIVITTDALVCGVHFRDSDPPAYVAQKLLRVNVSDLAAKGARPVAYNLTCMWPRVDEAWLAKFAKGLALDQREFGLSLIGGDTVSTSGPMAFVVTALGEVLSGKMLRRSGACRGDDIWVSGSIGDSGLGLKALEAPPRGISQREAAFLQRRFWLPEPRLSLALALREHLNASIDISDGLLADLTHICEASKVGMRLELEKIPLSRAAKSYLRASGEPISTLLTSGDDYEIAVTASPKARARIQKIAANLNMPMAKIGEIVDGNRVDVFDETGRLLQFARLGYTHF